MFIIKPSIEIQDKLDGIKILKKLEKVGRICYKSENKITKTSYKQFLRKIIDSGHESVLEHEKITVKVICDRGISHQIVRHRIASYSQESTIYCNYSKDKFGNEVTFILPLWFYTLTKFNNKQYNIWLKAMKKSENYYLTLIKQGQSAQEARSVLPISLKTEIMMTMNLREWRYFLKLRTSKQDHSQMREIALMILWKFKKFIPIIFEDII